VAGGEAKYPLPEARILCTLLDTPEAHPKLVPIKKSLQVLHELGITTLTQILNRKGTRVLLPTELLRSLPALPTPPRGNWKKALQTISTYLSTPPQTSHNPPPPSDNRTIHPTHLKWVERLTRQEHTAQPLPPTIKDLLLQITPPPPTHQRITLHCGGKERPA
jgi:hypothetical protein